MAFDPITALVDIGGKIFDRVIPDTNARELAKAELNKAINDQDFQRDLAQIQVNLEEAKSPNLFIAGWRPFLGWIGAIGLCYASLIEPLMRFILKTNGYQGDFPVIDTNITMQVLFSLLGIGAYRTIEKIKNAESNR